MTNEEANIIKIISELYSDTESVKILTNVFGKILWTNLNEEYRNKIFFINWNHDKSDNTIIGIEIFGKKFSAECSAVKVGEEKFWLLSVLDLKDTLNHLGNTDCYGDLSYILSIFKRSLKIISRSSEELYEKYSRLKDITVLKDQNKRCKEMLKYIHLLNNFVTMTFKKEEKIVYDISVKEEITKICTAFNQDLRVHGIHLNLVLNGDLSEVVICTGKEMLDLIIANSLNIAINSSMMSEFEIQVSADKNYAYINIPYYADEKYLKLAKSHNIEYVISAMIAECLGGKIETEYKDEDEAEIKIRIPLTDRPLMLCSPVFRNDAVSLREISELYFSEIRKTQDQSK